MTYYVNWDNCRKQYPEIQFRLDVRGILHVIGPKKYNPGIIVENVTEILRLDNKELAFSPNMDLDTTSDKEWHAKILTGIETEFFVKESSEDMPKNGQITRTFAILRFPSRINPLIDELQIYQVNSLEEAHKMAFEDQNCIGYDISKRVDTIVDGRIKQGKPDTKKRVIFGKVYTLKKVRRMKGEIAQHILTHMLVFGRNKTVKTWNGNLIPWEEGVKYFSKGIK